VYPIVSGDSWLQRRRRLALHFPHAHPSPSPHGHAFTAEDWTAMMDFFDKTLRGKPVTQTFDQFPIAK